MSVALPTQYCLGLLYTYGFGGVGQDTPKGRKYLDQSAAGGWVDAKTALAQLRP